MPQKLIATEEALARVLSGSLLNMRYATLTAQPVTRDLAKVDSSGDGDDADASFTNTFLNFNVPASKHAKRRSRSFGGVPRPAGTESCKAQPLPSVHLEAAAVAMPGLKTLQGTTTLEVYSPGDIGGDDLGSTACSETPPGSPGLASNSSAAWRCFDDVDAGFCGWEGATAVDHQPGQQDQRRKRRRSKQQSSICQDAAARTASSSTAARQQQRGDDSREYTTIMLKNLPQVFSQQDLMRAMDKHGFAKTYNFCYVPVNFQEGSCRGYAFINFRTYTVAAAFLSAWHGSRIFCTDLHYRPLVAVVAGSQGLEALVAQPSMKKLQRVRNPAYRPFIHSEL